MKTTSITTIKPLAIAAVAMISLVGCQVPGGSWGHEPMQIGMARIAALSLEAEETEGHPGTYEMDRTVSRESIALANAR